MLGKMRKSYTAFTKIMERINMNKNSTQGGRPILNVSNLHAYQRRAVQHILDKPKSALFLDMGL